MELEYYENLTILQNSKIKLLQEEINDLRQIIEELKGILYKTNYEFYNDSEEGEAGISGYFT